MKCYLVGIENASYTKKDTNQPIRAVNLHCLREVPRGLTDKCTGQLVKTYFCSGSLFEYCSKIPIGSIINVETEAHGRYEQVLDVELVESSEK